MALGAATIWGVKTTGNNANGGGWNDTGGASADYSENDAPILSVADAVANGTATVTSATGGFTAAMVGSVVNIVTKGRFQITVLNSGNSVDVDRNVAAGSGLTANVSGAVADLEQIDSVAVTGNTIHVEAGEYVSAGALLFPNGTSSGRIQILGYNSSRGDNPRDDNRPLLTLGANGFTLGNYNRLWNFRATTTNTSGIYVTQRGEARNVKSVNTGGNATDRAFRLDTGKLIDCEGICGNGRAVYVYGICNVLFNKFHDSNDGIYCYTNADYSFIGWNIVKDIANACLFADACNGMRVIHNAFDDGDIGIDADTVGDWIILNNQVVSNTSFPITWDTEHINVWLEGNNYFDNGNGNENNNATKGPGATANDPGFAGEDNFSEVDDDDGITMLLGVG